VFAGAEHIALTAHHGEKSHGLELGLAGVSLAVAVLGVLAALYAYLWRPAVGTALRQKLPAFHRLFAAGYYFDLIYDRAVVRPLFALAALSYRSIDVGIIDRMVNGMAAGVRASADLLRLVQTGNVRRYALAIALGAAVLLSLAGR
jgi:NADH-quinone oxidoreductase subunit L